MHSEARREDELFYWQSHADSCPYKIFLLLLIIKSREKQWFLCSFFCSKKVYKSKTVSSSNQMQATTFTIFEMKECIFA